jgi:hypothetical protein
MADLPEFVFPQHLIQDEYPAGATVRFGRGYTFASKPNGPDEVIFHLTFHNGLFFIKNTTAPYAPNDTHVHDLNILILHRFYASVLQYGMFTYNHPYRGKVTCRFNKPLLMPKVRTDTPGAVAGFYTGDPKNPIVAGYQTEAFDLEFILIP